MHVAESHAVTNPFYDAAEEYVRLGISVIPIQPGTKEPPVGFKWGEYATRIADASERYDWFVVRGWHLAVVAGPVSDNLVPLDFDSENGYPSFAALHPRMETYPRVRTGSGKNHVWVRTKKPSKKYVTTTPDGGKLEVRAGTHYTVVPPTVHPSGGVYEWIVPPWDGLPRIDLETIGLETRDPNPRTDVEPIDEGDPLTERERAHILELIKPHYVPNARHEICLALSGWLAGHSVPESDARWIVQSLAEAFDDHNRSREYLRGVRDTYRKARSGIAVAGWSRLTDAHDPLISPATAKQLDLLVRYRSPVFLFTSRSTGNHDRTRFRLIPAHEMKTRKPPKQLVHGVLAERSMAAVIGSWGTYKSFLGLDLAAHVGLGLDWHNHPVEAGFVIYVTGEGGSGMGKRIKAWEIANGREIENVWFVEEAVQFPDQRDIDAFLESLATLDEKPVLIIVDTLARSARGMEENSQKDMGLFVAGGDRIREATNAAVMIIHHTNRQGEYRGSSAFPGALDTMIMVERDDDMITLTCEKQKDLEPFEPIHLLARVVTIEESTNLLVPPVTSLVLDQASVNGQKMVGAIKIVYDVLSNTIGSDGATNSTWEQLSSDAGVKRRNFYHAKKALVEGDLVTVSGAGNSVRYYPK